VLRPPPASPGAKAGGSTAAGTDARPTDPAAGTPVPGGSNGAEAVPANDADADVDTAAGTTPANGPTGPETPAAGTKATAARATATAAGTGRADPPHTPAAPVGAGRPGSAAGVAAPTPAQLLRAARVVLARPRLAAAAPGIAPAEFAARYDAALRRMWDASAALRRAVLDVPGEAPAAAPATADPAPPARTRPDAAEKARRRQEQRIAELRERAATYRARAEAAVRDAAALRAQAREAEGRVREAEERAASAALERDTLARRADDPLRALRTLRRALRETPPEGSGTDSPKLLSDDQTIARSDLSFGTSAGARLRAALAAAGVAPAELRALLDKALVPSPGRPGTGLPPPPENRTLRVVPLGGGTEIGGSCVLVEYGGTRLLVDAGLRPAGSRPEPPALAAALRDGPPPAALVVTHAHQDHCGWVPAVTAALPAARVLCSPPTADLLPLVWQDAARVLHRHADERRAWGDPAAVAAYGPAEVAAACRAVEDVPYGTPVAVGELTVELFPAGHVLGSAGVVVTGGGRRIVVSGDLCAEPQLGAEELALPAAAAGADLLLLESTCCDAAHRPRRDTVAELVREVRETCEHGGRVLFPAMGVGRAQEVALLLGTRLPDLPVLVDGLAGAVAEAYGRHLDALPAGRPVLAERVRRVTDRAAQRLAFRAGAVITTAGTLRGGPAVEWAREILPDPASALFLSGYQDEEAPGRRLLGLTAGGPAAAPVLDLPGGDPVPVRAAVRAFQLGAHADRDALLALVGRARPRAVMLVHGRPGAQRRFRELLRVRGEAVAETGAWECPARAV
jgi:Cft2 family RNA processing exonuclease